MNSIVEKALVKWGLGGSEYRLAAARENAVYKVSSSDQHFAFRLHRKGYRTDQELNSELLWMAEASRNGISVPAPIASINGAFLLRIEDVQVDALTWLSGSPMSEIFDQLGGDERAELFGALGQEMARLHLACDNWTIPEGFERSHWSRDGLLGEIPLWDRFWENPGLTSRDQSLFLAFREAAASMLKNDFDYGLIHADLVPTNVLVDGATLHLIDFDDGGFGYRLFEVATALLKHSAAQDYPVLKKSLLDGYHSIRELDVSELDMFLAIRSLTYVGWNIERFEEPGGLERNERFIQMARKWVSQAVADP